MLQPCKNVPLDAVTRTLHLHDALVAQQHSQTSLLFDAFVPLYFWCFNEKYIAVEGFFTYMHYVHCIFSMQPVAIPTGSVWLRLAKRWDNHALTQFLNLHAENETVEFQPYPNEHKLGRSAKQTATRSLQPESQSDFSEKRTHYLKYLKQRAGGRFPAALLPHSSPTTALINQFNQSYRTSCASETANGTW